jgi:hypothetical protein
MSTFRLLGAAAVLFAITKPAMAQEVIYEPGYCAQYYPDANCQNTGPNNPDSHEYRRRIGQNGAVSSGDRTVGVAGKRSRTHRSNTSAIRTQ